MEPSGTPKDGPGQKSPNAGAERQPLGIVRSPESLAKALQEARAGLLGPPLAAPGLPTRHPRPVATFGVRPAGRTARA